MSAHHHPADAWLLDYTTGNLPESFETVISAHVGTCETCRASVQAAERIGGELLSALAGSAVTVDAGTIVSGHEPASAEDALPTRALNAGSDGSFDFFVSNYLKCSSTALPWKTLGKGLQICRLSEQDGVRLWMLKAQPGTVLPAHTHEGSELTLVLKGAYFCGSEIFRAGDIEDADETTEHQPVVTRDGECICLAVTEGRLRFAGLLPKLVQPFVGI